MKTIVNAKISHYDLATILLAARWQLGDWKAKTPTDAWDSAINATKYIERFMKDFPESEYLIRMCEKEF